MSDSESEDRSSSSPHLGLQALPLALLSSESVATTSTSEQNYHESNPIRLNARQSIQSDIEIYARTIVDLKSRLNTLTPIGTLPPEILSDILVRVAKDDYYSTGNISRYPYGRLHWMRMAHVCRRFRAVAFSTPRFWSYLRLTKSKTFAQLVTRSKSVPLHITADIEHSVREDRAVALNVLLQHSRRVEELRISGPIPILQLFCSKTTPRFDALQKIELVIPSGYSRFMARQAVATPVFASGVPPQLRHLELRGLPFRWDDHILSSPTLTTLIVAGKDTTRDHYAPPFPDVGAFDELLHVLKTVAPRLEILEIEDAIPRQGFDPGQHLLASRTISLPSIKSIRLAGEAPLLAYLLGHLTSPSTTSVNVTVRSAAGSGVSKELMQTIATHMSTNPPLLSLRLTSSGHEPLTLSGSAQSDHSGDPLLQVHFGSYTTSDLLLPVLQGAGPVFKHVQVLQVSGYFSKTKWVNIFPHLPSVTTLVMADDPSTDFFPALTTLRRAQNGGVYVALPHLRVLDLNRFRFTLPTDRLEPFDELLDWAIFRCNCGMPVDQIRLSNCKYAVGKKVKKLEEVVVTVEWDGWEMECTTEEEEEYDSDEMHERSEEEFYGGGRRYGRGWW